MTLNEGRFDDAIAGFAELKNYKDSSNQVIIAKSKTGIVVTYVEYANKEWLVLES